MQSALNALTILNTYKPLGTQLKIELLKSSPHKLSSIITEVAYRYPPATDEILNNVMECMRKIPKFYSHVLHIMNRMNLPPPFSDDCAGYSKNLDRFMELFDDWEDEDINEKEDERRENNVTYVKEKKGESSKANDVIEKKGESSKANDVIEKKGEPLKAMDLNDAIENDIKDIHEDKEDGNILKAEIKGKRKTDQMYEGVNLNKRLKLEEIKEIPTFKNYEKGTPSKTLFVKNLPFKTITLERLEEIFNSKKIRLMTHGRMRGQAFVAFETEEEAENAIDTLNGALIDDRPMIISFSNKEFISTL
jgi:U11/U12 small nuclear ribonucleoprotein SNRNP65